MYSLKMLQKKIKEDLLASENFYTNIDSIKSLCILLGPYRNLTTLTSSLLSLHPNCQVLNHAAMRVLPEKKINFFNDFTKLKFDTFLKYAIYISTSGIQGDWGGSILFSHAFDYERLKKAYEAEFTHNLIKQKIISFIWKDSQRITNYLINKKINIKSIIEKEPKIKFLMPIRNPLDTATSNLKLPHHTLLIQAKNISFFNVLETIIGEIKWFIELQKIFPNNFFYFFQNDFNKKEQDTLLNFLYLPHRQKWFENVKNCYHLKKSYDFSSDQKNTYKKLVAKFFTEDKKTYEKLLGFI